MKNRIKAPGPSDILLEMLKAGDEDDIEWMAKYHFEHVPTTRKTNR